VDFQTQENFYKEKLKLRNQLDLKHHSIDLLKLHQEHYLLNDFLEILKQRESLFSKKKPSSENSKR
jgi:hypothetical protein